MGVDIPFVPVPVVWTRDGLNTKPPPIYAHHDAIAVRDNPTQEPTPPKELGRASLAGVVYGAPGPIISFAAGRRSK